MSVVKILDQKSKNQFDKLASHPLQSWEWGEFRQKQGHKVIRLGEYEEQKLRAVYQVSFHQIPHLPFCIGYLPKSVLPTKEVIKKLKEIGQNEKAIFIKFEPDILKEEIKGRQLERLGLIRGKALFTRYTSVINLTQSEEDLLKNFKSKTRYNIRLAAKHGVTVQEESSPEAFDKYLNLIFETTNRQGFYAHNEKYHHQLWQTLKSSGIPHLLTAKYQGKMLASFMLFVFNKKLYYPYGASTREHRELMAPNLLMWEAIRFGKKMGCTSFDLWGDTEPNPAPDHPYYGFHRFKQGFSPKLVEFAGTYDLVINPLLYQIYKVADILRWKILRLKARL